MKEKSRKLFEKVDDNPGAYFGMLVEGFEDKEESLKESISKSDLYSALEYMYGFNKKEANDWIKKASNKMKQSVINGWKGNAKKSALTDSLKEDKFVSRDKMSKKDKKELDSQKRNTWGNTNPVTRVQPNKKAYDRKRDKKVVEESKKLKEDVSVTEEDDYDRFYSDEWWYIGPELSEYGSVEYPYLTKTLKDVDSNDELYLKVEVPYSDSDNDFEDYEPFIDSNFGLKWFGKGSRQFKYAVKKICDYLNSEGIEVNITEERFKRI